MKTIKQQKIDLIASSIDNLESDLWELCFHGRRNTEGLGMSVKEVCYTILELHNKINELLD